MSIFGDNADTLDQHIVERRVAEGRDGADIDDLYACYPPSQDEMEEAIQWFSERMGTRLED